MARSSGIRIVLVIWCVLEVLIFAALVHVAGLGPVLLAEFLTGLLGIALLKRTGAAALIQVRNAFRAGSVETTGGHLVDGGLSILGSLAILLPGFLSDLVGLVLLVRPLRVRAARLLAGRGGMAARRSRAPESGVVDLEPGQWRRADERGPSELPRR